MLNLIVAPSIDNPKAEKCAKKVVRILKAEKLEYSVYFCQTYKNMELNIQEILPNLNETEFILVGDDVLLHKFVNSIKDISKLKIGLIPVGKTLDFSTYIGISKKPTQAVRDILEKNIESIDYLLLNNVTKIVNNITVGASAEMFELYKQYKLQNALTKKYLTFKYGNKFEGIELGFSSQKTTRPKYENIFELSIANGGLLDGKHLSPLSCVQDGLLNVNYTEVPQVEDRKKYLKMFKTGNQVNDNGTKQLWKNTVHISNPDRRIKIIADGNLMTVDEIDVQVVENGLKIYKKID